MKKLIAVICFWGMLLGGNALAQFDADIRTFTIEEGLPNNTVHSINSDSLGFTWISTGSGLARFDGHSFKSVQLPREFSTSSLGKAFKLNNQLLFCVENQIWSYNLYENKWTEEAKAPVSGRISFLDVLGNNIFFYNVDQQICREVIHGGSTIYRSFDHPVKVLKVIDERYAIIATNNAVHLLNSANLEIRKTFPIEGIKDIDIENRESVLLSGENGIYRLWIFNESVDQVTSEWNVSQMRVGPKYWWCAALSKGLLRIDPQTLKTEVMMSLQRRNASDSQLTSIQMDQNQMVWVGTRYNGMHLLSLQEKSFLHYHPGNLKGLLDENIIGFAETDGKRFILTANKVYQWLPEEKEVQLLPINQNTTFKGFFQKKNRLYLFSNKGIFRYNKGRFRSIVNTQNLDVNALHLRANGIWIIATNENEFIQADSLFNVRSRIVPGKMRTDYLPPNRLTSALEVKSGKIIIGTENGLAVYNEGSMSFNVLIKTLEAGPSSNVITTLFQDSLGNVWVGTENGGLSHYNPEQRTFINYGVNEGFLGHSVYSINEDRNNRLWLGTDQGLYRFDPKEKRFTRFSTSDGIQDNRFLAGSTFRLSTGEMLMGGINGFNQFDPNKIGLNTRRAPLVITELKINNQPHSPNQEKFELKYNENDLAIDFSLLNYNQSGKNNYSVKLTNWDDDWVNLGNSHSLSYNNLQPGTYHLMIKGWNNDGYEGIPIDVIFSIAPPWWLTGWAYLFYLLFSVLLVGIVLRFIAQRLRLKNQLRIEKLERKQAEEMINFKLKFYTNISHEIRTPLTLISGPMQQLSERFTADSEEGKQVNIMRQNTNRLLRLVEQLLDFRKLQSDKLPFAPANLNISSFIRDVVMAFQGFAQSKNIEIEINLSDEVLVTQFDPDKMEKILYNLLSNAVKHAPDSGKVGIEFSHSEELFNIKVWDNGDGIVPEKQEKIFDRFEADGGIGIGLALTRELVKMHNGTIKVESKPGEGSCFIVDIPLVIVDKTEMATDVTEDGVHNEQTLLIAEDNSELREYIAQLFVGYHVIQAENGRKAWEAIDKKQPDIIISDVMMPEMTGIELCEKVKNDIRFSHIPVVLLTAYSDTTHQLQGSKAGADLYIGKPFNNELLVSKVAALIENRARAIKHYQQSEDTSIELITQNSLDKGLVDQLCELIEKHIDNSELNVELLASEVGLSRSQLTRKLTSIADLAPGQFIQNYRLKKAAYLLKNSELNVSEIAYKTGFSDPKYFSRNFKKLFDVTPSEYRSK
ncbi:hybrid sensor histidine kinase/response regulator [Prolixibacteraceae bacterium JC049]|nr:hybrid sensor histidine kinase/response regulator [Prolixibacteraceae bacterium JC049]